MKPFKTVQKTITLLSFSLLSVLSSATALASQADDIEITEPFAREVPPGAPASASFMTLENISDAPIKIVSAQSTVSKVVELHTHTNDNGVMRMRQIPFIEVPANGMAFLKPGGLHIMLIEPINSIKQGQTVSVTLTFEDGSQKQVDMPVKSFMSKMGHMNGHSKVAE